MNVHPVSSAPDAPARKPRTSGANAAATWASRILTGLVLAFLLMDIVMKLLKPPFVVEATVKLGYPESTITGIGLALLLCTVLYAIPRTAVLGATLLTGYLGGAVASNVRAATPVFNAVFPVLFAVLVWAPLVIRRRELRAMLLSR